MRAKRLALITGDGPEVVFGSTGFLRVHVESLKADPPQTFTLIVGPSRWPCASLAELRAVVAQLPF